MHTQDTITPKAAGRSPQKISAGATVRSSTVIATGGVDSFNAFPAGTQFRVIGAPSSLGADCIDLARLNGGEIVRGSKATDFELIAAPPVTVRALGSTTSHELAEGVSKFIASRCGERFQRDARVGIDAEVSCKRCLRVNTGRAA